MNENRFFWTFRYFLKFRLFLNKLKIASTFFCRFPRFGFLPTDVPYISVIGKGIKGRNYGPSEKATHEEVNEAHAQYIE